jgi:hypothetical protein
VPTLTREYVHPPARSLPIWPGAGLDTTGTSHLIVWFGGTVEAQAAAPLIARAQSLGPTSVLAFSELGEAEAVQLRSELRASRIGVRLLVVGGRFDVFQALALARTLGVLPPELRCILTHQRDLPVYCAHCRRTTRVEAEPGGRVVCAGCSRTLEIHEHTSELRGSFLASLAEPATVDTAAAA